jgi:AcrR family transcriptional regulator
VGFADTYLDEVVARAHVTKGALYHHFDSREGLFARFYERGAAHVLRDARAFFLAAGRA